MNQGWGNNQGGYNPNVNPNMNNMNNNAFQAMNQNALQMGMGMMGGINNGGMGGMGGMGMNTNAYNPGVNTDVSANLANKLAGLTNPNNLTLPTCQYSSGCKKCMGSGRVMKNGAYYPCKKCYKKGGYCKVCLGTRVNYLTGQQCMACQNGSYMKGHKGHGHKHGKGGKGKGGHNSSGSSSDSDW